MKNHFFWNETRINIGGQTAILDKVLSEICACVRINPNITSTFIFADIYRYNTSSFNYKIQPKPLYSTIAEAEKGYLLNGFKNHYFDYSQKKPFAIAPVIYVSRIITSLTKEISLILNKIRYSEIVDFDFFYSNTNDFETYKIEENIRNEYLDSKETNNALFSFNIASGNLVYQYDITTLSMDNILSNFNGVFQFLTILFGFVGNFLNQILFSFEKRKYFYSFGGYKSDIKSFNKETLKRRDFYDDEDICESKGKSEIMRRVYRYAKAAVEHNIFKGKEFPQLKKLAGLAKKTTVDVDEMNIGNCIKNNKSDKVNFIQNQSESEIDENNDEIKNKILDKSNNEINYSKICLVNCNNKGSSNFKHANAADNSERHLQIKQERIEPPPQKINFDIEMEHIKVEAMDANNCGSRDIKKEISGGDTVTNNVKAEIKRISESNMNDKNYNITRKDGKTKSNNKIDYKKEISINNNENNEYLEYKQKEQITNYLFEEYVNSFEFLYDVFSQIEMLKIILLNEKEFLDFKYFSRAYISFIDAEI